MDFDVATAGGFWIVPTIVAPSTDPVQIVVAIAVSDDAALGPSDISVAVSSGGSNLTQLSGPDSSAPLPLTEMKGLTAQAFFMFDNPQSLTVDSVVVTIGNESATFGSGSVPNA